MPINRLLGCSLGEKCVRENCLVSLNACQVLSLRYSNRTLYFWRVLRPMPSASLWVPQIRHPELQFSLAVVCRIISVLPTSSPDFLIFPWHRYPPHSCLVPTRRCVFCAAFQQLPIQVSLEATVPALWYSEAVRFSVCFLTQHDSTNNARTSVLVSWQPNTRGQSVNLVTIFFASAKTVSRT